MSNDSKAIFLSYASEDAAAARRICERLRETGVQVWFDQSELRGGDSWDNAIRQRIKSCALFIAVVSRNTHQRDEGYFRLEWKLAVDRSHLMSKTRPFLIPVVIDDTPNDEQVPDGFREVQWMRLAGGEPNGTFVARILSLLPRSSPVGGEHPELPAAEPCQSVEPHLFALRQEVRFARGADGTGIAFATLGSGYPVVDAAHWLSHLEFDLQTPVWRPWIEWLSAHYRLTRYDSRGCGLSDRDVSKVGLEDLVADLAAVVDAAGLERFALIAKSQGGAVSIAYAAAHPERVSHLVLCGAFARSGFGREPNLRERAARLARAFARMDASSYLGQIACPTLVIHCRGDAVIPCEEGRFLAASIAGARFESLESQNHVPLAGEPAFDRLLDLLREFLPA